MYRTIALGLGILCALSAAKADEVIFKNGDRLSGTIVTYDGAKLTIKSASTGKIDLELKNVKTFSSDGPIDVVLKNGTVIHRRAVAGPGGQVTFAGEGPATQPTTQPATIGPLLESVAFDQIKAINPPPVVWTGNLVLGGMLTRGNTNTENFNAAFHLGRRREIDRINFDASYLYGRERVPGAGDHETQNNWVVEGKYDYFFNPKLYGYGDVRVERDVIAGLDLRLTPGVGAGYQWFDGPVFKFNTEGGVSYLYRSYSNDGTSESVSLRLAYHLNWKINDKVALTHNVEYYPGLDRISNYLITADAGVRTTLTDKMFAEFKIEERYDSQPAPGKTYNDTRYILGVGWSF